MLRSVRNLHGMTLHAEDGEIGSVRQVFFDDDAWGIRYLVVKTGAWLVGREVLISPLSVGGIDDDAGTIDVRLTQQQIRDSPDIDTHKPVLRQHEIDYFGYYGYAPYWGGPYLAQTAEYPVLAPIPPAPEDRRWAELEVEVRSEDAHLRSSETVRGYRIHARDGGIGHVADLLFDDQAWLIRYLVVDTRKWWPGGRMALVATEWIDDIDWADSEVRVALGRETIRASPEYDDATAISQEYEASLRAFYDKQDGSRG